MAEMKPCAVEACGRRARKRSGLCGMHYRRQWRGIPLDLAVGARRALKKCIDCGLLVLRGPRCAYHGHAKRNAAFRVVHPEYSTQYCRRWRAAHPARSNAYQAKRKARLLGVAADGHFTPADADLIFLSQDGLCLYCGCPIDRAGSHIDHMVPLSRGGSNAPANIAFACVPCNLKKSTRTAEEYMKMREGK